MHLITYAGKRHESDRNTTFPLSEIHRFHCQLSSTAVADGVVVVLSLAP